MGVVSACFHIIVNGESLWNVFCCLLSYFTAKLHQFLTLGQFENLVFVIMSTRENIRLIARTSFDLMGYYLETGMRFMEHLLHWNTTKWDILKFHVQDGTKRQPCQKIRDLYCLSYSYNSSQWYSQFHTEFSRHVPISSDYFTNRNNLTNQIISQQSDLYLNKHFSFPMMTSKKVWVCVISVMLRISIARLIW